jgi:hypothetical protein
LFEEFHAGIDGAHLDAFLLMMFDSFDDHIVVNTGKNDGIQDAPQGSHALPNQVIDYKNQHAPAFAGDKSIDQSARRCRDQEIADFFNDVEGVNKNQAPFVGLKDVHQHKPSDCDWTLNLMGTDKVPFFAKNAAVNEALTIAFWPKK